MNTPTNPVYPPATMQPQPRKAGVGEILKDAWHLYTSRARAWIVPLLTIQLPLILVTLTAVFLWMWKLIEIVAVDPYYMEYYGFSNQVILFFGSYFLILFFVMATSVFLGTPAQYAQYVGLLEHDMNGMDTLRFTFKRYGRALGHSLIYSLIITAASWVLGSVFQVFISTAGGLSFGAIAQNYATGGMMSGMSMAVVGMFILMYVVLMVGTLVINGLFSLILPISASSGQKLGVVLSRSLREVKGVLLGGILAQLIVGLVLGVVIGILSFGFAMYVVATVIPYANASPSDVMPLFAQMMPMIVAFMVVVTAASLFLSPLAVAIQCAMHRLSRPEQPRV